MTAPPGVFTAPAQSGQRDNRKLLFIALGIALAGILIGAILVAAGSGKKASAAEVLREPVASDGPVPWMGSIADPSAPTSVPTPPTTTPAVSTTKAPSNVITAVRGDRAGIYGGTLKLSVCDKTKLIDFLEGHPSQAAAWARVEGIRTADIRPYINSLTPVILAVDTRVTNHGFSNGRATAHQSVLQAGTAVLIDSFGVPRARCFCGNPLLPPQLAKSAPAYSGPTWTGFDPSRVVVVQPASAPVTNITIINTDGGGTINLPLGSPAAITTTSTTELVIPNSTPPTTLATVTVPGQGIQSSIQQPITTSKQTTTTAAATTAPPQTTTTAPSTQWKLSEVRFFDELKNNPLHSEPSTPSATGGSTVITVRGGGGLCDGQTEDARLTWTFPKDVTNLKNGDPIAINMTATTIRKAPGCDGAIADKSFIHIIANVETGAFVNPEAGQIDGDRFTGGARTRIGPEGSGNPPSAADSISVATTASNPAKPEAFFGMSFEGFGFEYRFLYIYRQV